MSKGRVMDWLTRSLAGYFLASVTLVSLYCSRKPWADFDAPLPGVFVMEALLAALPWGLGAIVALAGAREMGLSWRRFFAVCSLGCLPFPLMLLLLIPGVLRAGLLPVGIGLVVLVTGMVLPWRLLKAEVKPGVRGKVLWGVFTLLFLFCMAWMFQTCLYHDAGWNFGYLRSMVLDGDLDLYNEFILHNSYSMYQPHPNEPVFFFGSALFMAPFFLIGHGITLLCAGQPDIFTDGYSWPVMILTCLAGVSAGFLLCLLLYRLGRLFFSCGSVFLALVGVFFAGNLMFFTFVWPLYTHVFSALLSAGFVLYWIKTRKSRSWVQSAVWGGILGLAMWVRPQSILMGLIPLLVYGRMFWMKEGGLRQTLLCGLAFAGGCVLCFSPQMVVWQSTAGTPILHAYSTIGDDFFWNRPRFLYLLFTWNRGFLSWNPVFILLIPGFFFLVRRLRSIAWPLLIVFLLQMYLVACYEFPEGGAGFGARYLIDGAPFYLLCLAALADRMRRRKWTQVLVAGLVMLVGLNLCLMVLYHREMIPHNGAEAPEAAELGRLLWERVPQELDDFVFSSHINENVFARPWLSGLLRADVAAVACCTGGFLLVACWLVVVGGLGWRCRAWKHRWSVVLLGCLCFGIASVDIFLLTLDVPDSRRGIYPVLAVAYDRQEEKPAANVREFRLTPYLAHRQLDIPYEQPVSILDITMTSGNVRNVRAGERVARILVIGAEEGQQVEFPVLWEQDLASHERWSSLFAGTPLPDDRKQKVVQHWLAGSLDAGYYRGAGYWKRCELPAAWQVRRIDVRWEAASGDITVTGMYLLGDRGMPLQAVNL